MNPTVCLLTAGKGGRMGPTGEYLNKALFPIAKKATISHIIEKFPATTEFVIGLGFLGEQVRSYLQIAHPDRNFKFVNISKYEGAGSGPGFSLLCCREHLNKPFYFVSCDTLWDNPIDWNEHINWMGVARVKPEVTGQYCNMRVHEGAITELRDKVIVEDLHFQAFVGLCFIKDCDIFWPALERKDTVAGEHQISNGLKELIERKPVAAKEIEWTDVGDLDKYKRAVSRFEDFDFSKLSEALYIVDTKVIKFFADSTIAERRVQKSQLRPSVFPVISEYRNQFFSYEFWPGKTMYQYNNPKIFARLLTWLDENLWERVEVESSMITKTCRKFYCEKTTERIDAYQQKYGLGDFGSSVNGRNIPATADLIAKIPWEHLCQGVPTFIHGDLQFDNILYDEKSLSFLLLDWRQDFGGHLEFGDLYYDLAKLYGGIILNYDYIKLNLLTYHEEEGVIFFDFAQRFQSNKYLEVLETFIRSKGWDLEKVRLLVPIIYLNMAPLHHYPFDKMLYSLGRDMLYTELERIH